MRYEGPSPAGTMDPGELVSLEADARLGRLTKGQMDAQLQAFTDDQLRTLKKITRSKALHRLLTEECQRRGQ